MLEQIDLTKKMSAEEYKQKIDELLPRLSKLQRELKSAGIPIMIVFEGFGAAGKGYQIGKLIQALDPRGFNVYSTGRETEDERMHPFLWRFWNKIPMKGRIAIYDKSWYRRVLADRMSGEAPEYKYADNIDQINTFERQLTDDNYCIIKLFLVIDQKEQKKRFKKLLESKATAWRVNENDLYRNKHYNEYAKICDEMLQRTETDYAPWNIIEAMDRKFATVKIYSQVIAILETALAKSKEPKDEDKSATRGSSDLRDILRTSSLASADLSLSLEKEEYKLRLKELQNKISYLHGEFYRHRIPVILGFEGWDAGGKGGAIKRLTEKMDARGYTVHPTSAANDIERAHNYLWRFWNCVPKDGHIAIFDRTWYGRVMVERIEGFCTTEEWQRAYKEINEMEREFYRHGAVIIKFWMQIDKDEQERRFKERMENPEKQWKITDEDWRNREKWDLYEEAVDEMLVRTSTTYAPWVIVEGNSKYYARIKVLETVVDAMEKKLKEVKKKK